MSEQLAVIEGETEFLAAAIERAALAADGADPYDEMYLRIDEDGVETPASAAHMTQASYCTMQAEMFDRYEVTEPVGALFPVEEVLGWLAWFDGRVTLAFLGDPGVEVVSALRIHDDDHTVTVDCVDDPTLLEDVEVWLPDRFDGDQFLDERGDPLPARIETDIETLARIVTAAERCGTHHPLRVEDGTLRLAVDGETATVRGDLSGTVEGPDLHNEYGPGFARIVGTIDGPVELQTGPDDPLVVVSKRPGAVRRYFVAPVE